MRGTSGKFDYIVVGSGSAGSAMARRLSDDPTCRVLLLEAGGSDSTWKIQMPSAYSYPLADRRYSWCYETEPQPHLQGRRIAWPAGRVLGGSSSINGMVFLRGHPANFDGWAANGAAGWSYAEVLPYFKRAETRIAGANGFRGDSGPMTISPPLWRTPLYDAFVRAGVEAGFAQTDDFNGAAPEGFGPFEMNVKRGVRASTYRAYLRPVRGRANLEVAVGAQVTRIVVAQGRAIAVEYATARGKTRANCDREIVLCAGAIHSPRLLLLSGIGPADELRALGIPVLQDLPGVGRNLQDHLELYVQFNALQPVTLYSHLSLRGKVRIGAEWFLNNSGLGTTNHAEAGALIRRSPASPSPDVQFHFVPMAIDYHGNSPVRGHSFQVHAGPTAQTSVGAITLASADPRAAPRLDPNYLSTDADRSAMRDCVRIAREVMAQPAMRSFAGAEIAPGSAAQSDRDLDEFIQRTAESGYHYGGTCRMGRDSDAVTDEAGRVRGVAGLRVADASIMPRLVNCNTNAASIMIGEKIADHVLGREMLPAADVDVLRQVAGN